MNTKLGSDTTTEGVQVIVEPKYEPDCSKPDKNRFMHSYKRKVSKWVKNELSV